MNRFATKYESLSVDCVRNLLDQSLMPRIVQKQVLFRHRNA